MRSEVFVARTDAEAVGRANRTETTTEPAEGVSTPGVTTWELDVLQSVLTGEAVEDVVREGGGDAVAAGREPGSWLHRMRGAMLGETDTGPWLNRLRPELTGALAAATEEQLSAAAAAWAGRPELADSDATDLAGVLPQLAALARDAGAGQLYIWSALPAT
ncbi:MAG: hypothetical protein DLM56_10485 [Pseudonocardiales bacterium]|nr:MAG: hypothetical protein DLM56_10485 [Pseudonocardiales bacterium]